MSVTETRQSDIPVKNTFSLLQGLRWYKMSIRDPLNLGLYPAENLVPIHKVGRAKGHWRPQKSRISVVFHWTDVYNSASAQKLKVLFTLSRLQFINCVHISALLNWNQASSKPCCSSSLCWRPNSRSTFTIRTQHPQHLGILPLSWTWHSAKPASPRSSALEFDLPLHVHPRHTTYLKTGKNLPVQRLLQRVLTNMRYGNNRTPSPQTHSFLWQIKWKSCQYGMFSFSSVS